MSEQRFHVARDTIFEIDGKPEMIPAGTEMILPPGAEINGCKNCWLLTQKLKTWMFQASDLSQQLKEMRASRDSEKDKEK